MPKIFTIPVSLSIPMTMPLTKQHSSDQSTGSSSHANFLKKLPDTGRFPTQSGNQNMKRFMLFFRKGNSMAAASPTGTKSISVNSIGAPIIGSNTEFRKINEPKPKALNEEIEAFRRASKEKNNSETRIAWEVYLRETTDAGLQQKILALKHRLMDIDDKVNRGIDELRLTAYDNIRNAKAQYKPSYPAEAKNRIKAKFRESFFSEPDRSIRRADHPPKPAQPARQVDAAVVQDAIDCFKQRVTRDFEANRLTDVNKACIEALQAHFEGRTPTGLFYQLVREVSPDAAEQYIKTLYFRA